MPCLHGGICIDDIDGFHCNCSKDFMGQFCERPYDICELKPCQNNASCVTTNGKDFSCNCLAGIFTTHLEKSRNITNNKL